MKRLIVHLLVSFALSTAALADSGLLGAQGPTPQEREKAMREAVERMHAQARPKRTPAERVARSLTPEQTGIALALIADDRQDALARIARASGSLVFPVYEGSAEITPLGIAAQRADIEVLRALLAKGVPADSALDANKAKHIDGSTALILAVQHAFGRDDLDRRMEAINLLLQKGASPLARGPSGQTAFGHALKSWWQERAGTVRIVTALIRGGADINENLFAFTGVETALSWAVGPNNTPLVEFLLAQGADPRAHGSIALEAAGRQADPALMKLLLAKGADPNAALQQAVIFSFQPASRAKVTLLLESGADPNVCDATATGGKCANHGKSLLALALDRADLGLAKELLRHGAKPNAVSGAGGTVLGLVLAREPRRYDNPNDKFDRLASVNLLLESGADPNLRSGGALPMSLVPGEDLPILRALLDRGGEGEVAAVGGITIVGPITVAIGRQQYVLADELLRRAKGKLDRSERHILRVVATSGKIELAKTLQGAGADCKSRGPLDETPLHVAAQAADASMAALLLDCGADPNARTVSIARAAEVLRNPVSQQVLAVVPAPPLIDGGETPLMVAATAQLTKGDAGAVAKALLRRGANASLVSERGKTALMLARDFFNSQVETALSAP